jgi:hypothetical protein
LRGVSGVELGWIVAVLGVKTDGLQGFKGHPKLMKKMHKLFFANGLARIGLGFVL